MFSTSRISNQLEQSHAPTDSLSQFSVRSVIVYKAMGEVQQFDLVLRLHVVMLSVPSDSLISENKLVRTDAGKVPCAKHLQG